MRKHVLWIFLLTCTIFLTACQTAPSPTQTLPPTAAQTPPITTTAPAPTQTGAVPSNTAPPAGETESLYPPVPEDADRVRGNFFIDSASLVPVTGNQGTVELRVEGSLPTPCNQPRVLIQPPDQDRRITVEMYTVVQTDQMCTQVIKPFSGPVATLQGLSPGDYTLVVNDQEMGEFKID